MKTKYICETCGKEFDDSQSAYKCEDSHGKDGYYLEVNILPSTLYIRSCKIPKNTILGNVYFLETYYLSFRIYAEKGKDLNDFFEKRKDEITGYVNEHYENKINEYKNIIEQYKDEKERKLNLISKISDFIYFKTNDKKDSSRKIITF